MIKNNKFDSNQNFPRKYKILKRISILVISFVGMDGNKRMSRFPYYLMIIAWNIYLNFDILLNQNETLVNLKVFGQEFFQHFRLVEVLLWFIVSVTETMVLVLVVVAMTEKRQHRNSRRVACVVCSYIWFMFCLSALFIGVRSCLS